MRGDKFERTITGFMWGALILAFLTAIGSCSVIVLLGTRLIDAMKG